VNIERSRLSAGAFIIGVVTLLATGIRYLFIPTVDTLVWVGIGIGVVALAASALVDPDRIRNALRGRQGRYGSNALVLSLAFAGVLVVLNVLAFNNPQRIDLTEDKVFSLAPETILLLSELSDPVEITGFYSPDRTNSRDQMRPILDEYRERSGGLVSYEFIDPRANPLAADLHGITRDGSMAVSIGDESHVIDFPSEREITSAIVRLGNPETRVVYFLTGHGERDLEASDDIGLSQLKSSLEAKNYAVAQLNLPVEGSIPSDAVVLLVAAPRAPLSDEELALVATFLDGGGSLVALLEPSAVTELAAEADSLNAYLLEGWGLWARDDFVIDLEAMHPFVGLSFSYANHAITERVQGFLTQYPSARSIQVVDEPDAALSITQLVLTSERSWGETDFAAIADGSTIEIDEGLEAAGPLALAVAAENNSTDARMVVVGDADFAGNGAFFVGGNGDLIVNSVDWAAKQENLIDITPGRRTQRQVIPATRSTVLLLILGTAVVIPVGILVAGGSVWWGRRKRT
jgi:ABC-type uncharacterized transport system involved in gliding motility auxiliary subunit